MGRVMPVLQSWATPGTAGLGAPIRSIFRSPRRSRSGSAGQAMVEFALLLAFILPLLVGLADITRQAIIVEELGHAAREGAVAGASNPGDSCGVAQSTAQRIYRWSVDSSVCETQGQDLALTLTDYLGVVSPFWPDGLTISATARAVLR